jgi:hypothetical protein
MRWIDAVWQARKNLTKAGLDFDYIEYGSYTSMWRKTRFNKRNMGREGDP